MDDEDYKVSSEIYSEFDYRTTIKPKLNKNDLVSRFPFKWPPKLAEADNDGDLVVERSGSDAQSNSKTEYVEIEHSGSTVLGLVGLQVWRGALLLADWLFHIRKLLNNNSVILELGSGVGLTSIIASHYAPVVCTDVNKGEILKLIESNVARNSHLLLEYPVKVLELDFTRKEFSQEIENILPKVEVILAADVVYDDEITLAFVDTLDRLLCHQSPPKCAYVALEKRYVFTISDCDSVAPCYDYFLECLRNKSNLVAEEVDLNFPQFFEYNRVRELVLWKIVSKNKQ